MELFRAFSDDPLGVGDIPELQKLNPYFAPTAKSGCFQIVCGWVCARGGILL